MNRHHVLLLSLLTLLSGLCGCKHSQRNSGSYVYVVPKQVFLRDRVAAVSNKVAAVSNGQRLEVVERGRRFVKVKTEAGQTGWLEEHAVIDQGDFDAFDGLRRQHTNDPVVATAILRDEVYGHLSPGRGSERFLLLPEGDKLQLLERASVARPTPEQLFQASARKQAAKAAAAKQAQEARTGKPPASGAKPGSGSLKDGGKAAASPASPSHPAAVTPVPPAPPEPVAKAASAAKKGKAAADAEPPMEDWWLVRDGDGRVAWLMARRIDVDVPDEVVRYAEGQRIVGAYLLAKVPDAESPFPDHQAPEYVTVLNPYKDGLPYDFSMVRVFVWNVKKHRYEGGLRLKDLVGYLPVTVKQQTLDKAGPVPTFTVKLAADGAVPSIDPATGAIRAVATFTETYRLDGEMVKRVLGADESAPARASSASPAAQQRARERAQARASRRAARRR